jgi:hypothetical protein
VKWLWAKLVWFEYRTGHCWLGAFTFALGWLNPAYAVLWVVLYLAYQIVESYWVKDRGDIDIKDFMIGFGAGGFICIVLLHFI